jgi:ribosomal-protein-alanine N-acetyltransferase
MDGPVLETSRLVLRPLVDDDVEALHALFDDATVVRYMLDGERVARDWVASVIARSAQDFADRGLGLWAARERETPGRLIGLVGYRDFHEPPVFELLYALRGEAQGRGLAVEMARAATRAGFGAGLPRIRASTDEPNVASVRVMERLGMRFAGREEAEPWAQLHYVLEPG